MDADNLWENFHITVTGVTTTHTHIHTYTQRQKIWINCCVTVFCMAQWLVMGKRWVTFMYKWDYGRQKFMYWVWQMRQQFYHETLQDVMRFCIHLPHNKKLLCLRDHKQPLSNVRLCFPFTFLISYVYKYRYFVTKTLWLFVLKHKILILYSFKLNT
jgi:hypothetical protein